MFQEKLGSLYDKAVRLQHLTEFLTQSKEAARAGLLAKVDLVTEMVGEFPELQGTVGYYYALENEKESVANAIAEQYLPKFAGDALPNSELGCALAIADRLDTLVGIFGIGQAPTGDKDPFGLRRAALGIIRIVLEKEYSFDLPFEAWLTFAAKNYQIKLSNKHVVNEVKNFILERLNGWYQERNISADKLLAALAVNNDNLQDIHARVLVIDEFSKRIEAADLVTANKRVANILRKEKVTEFDQDFSFAMINEKILNEPAEKNLYQHVHSIKQHLNNSQKNYSQLLNTLAELHLPLNRFFDEVLVNADDESLKRNRLILLCSLRELFLKVADISLLSGNSL